MSSSKNLLFEIGCEELPASFVEAALAALPALVKKQLDGLRLSHESVRALGSPRRLTVVVDGLAEQQPDLEEEMMGPPVKVAFRDGQPTKAAEAFAKKVGCALDELERVETPKGEYLRGTRSEKGRAASELLPEALANLATQIPFRKSMRWGSGSLSFGRPMRWLLALFGEELLPVSLGDLKSDRLSYGHRFLHPDAISLPSPDGYVDALRQARVLVDPEERANCMRERLLAAAQGAGGVLIEDEFLIGENLSLVEDPQVIVGRFEEVFLELPEEVILEVARGHQRYFGMRSEDGRLLPRYLAVVNTAENPEAIQLGNDRVMRARLADAQFFYQEDLKRPLAERGKELEGIVFQKRLGTVYDKVKRIETLSRKLGERLGLDAAVVDAAIDGARLCKCDLVTLMVGEFPELQGDVGYAYAMKQGASEAVATVIRDHYKPKGASDSTAVSEAAAIVALADRLDTLVGCFAIGLSPTGAADPYGLRRACLGVLRTLLDRGFSLQLAGAFADAYASYGEQAFDLDEAALSEKLSRFFRERLRGLLNDGIPNDVVEAVLGVAADQPVDARKRAAAIVKLDGETRAKLGEVFKRATNIAKNAPEGEPTKGEEESETKLYDAFFASKNEVEQLCQAGDYALALGKLADLAPVLGNYFDEVLVMADDPAVRDNRLRLMRVISETCSGLARLECLGA